MTVGPLDLLSRIADLLDALSIPYALGGSMASSLFGMPRSTVDIDIAVDLPADRSEALLQAAAAEFYVPLDAARAAIRAATSFNLVDTQHGMKVDLFVLGDGLLDRMQIERRVRVHLPATGRAIWATSPEVQGPD